MFPPLARCSDHRSFRHSRRCTERVRDNRRWSGPCGGILHWRSAVQRPHVSRHRVSMALVLCPKHGGGCAAVCLHFAAMVYAGTPIRQARFPISVTYAGQTLGPTWLCAECAARFNVPAEGVTLTDDNGLDIFWCKVDWKPVCPGCYDACRGTLVVGPSP